MATWSRSQGLGDGRHLGCGPSRRFSRAAVEGGPSGEACSSGHGSPGDPILPSGSERAGRGRTSVRSRFVSFFQRRGASVSDRRCQGPRWVGVNPLRHADAEVGRSEIALAVDGPLSQQDLVGDVVRGVATCRAVACHREGRVWRARGCARGSVQLKKSTSGTWPSCSNRKGRASQPERGGETRKGCERV
jgi:hypothetical protein